MPLFNKGNSLHPHDVPRLVRGIHESFNIDGSRGQAAGRRRMGCIQAVTNKVLIITCFSFGLYAQPSSLSQTENKLKQLNAQISSLQKVLVSAHDKRGILNKELNNTEKQIGNGVHQLRVIEGDINFKQQKIAALQEKANVLNAQLSKQQQLFASHLRARYQMGEYQPLKWVLTQDDPTQISRMLTYYQYIVTSRQQLMDQIDLTRKNINENKETIHKELSKKQKLQVQLAQHQTQLKQEERYHTALIHSLNNEIQNKQHTLKDYQRNRDNLTRLFKSLSLQSTVRNTTPFLRMRKKLPFPVHTERKSLQRMNQGVTFFAEEGAVVTAIYPGKVVFSGWLKGYGLLLIIDHGQGFMTLYAHNHSLFKRKGQSVHQNEQIASVGHTGGIKQNGLYFEIRQRGKAVPPLSWLS